MRSPLTLCVLLSQFFVKGVFGVDGDDEVKSVSVMEGDSVTLNTDITEIQTDDQILWMFNNTRIAEIYKRYNVSSHNGTFRDKRRLDNQTGSLTIKDSGVYVLEIINSSGTFYKRFNVIFYESKVNPHLRLHGLFLAPVVTTVLILAAAAAAKCCKTNKQTAQDHQEAEVIPMNHINNDTEPAMDEVIVERPISNGVAVHVKSFI